MSGSNDLRTPGRLSKSPAEPATRWLRMSRGALVDQYYYFDINSVYSAGTTAENHMLFWPEWSQIVAHWRFILTGTREAITRPTLSSMGLPAGWDMLAPALLIAAALACLMLIVPWHSTSHHRVKDFASKLEV